MALIKCLECKAQISDNATVCPKCGNPVDLKKLESLKKQKQKPLNAGCIIGLIVIGIIFAICMGTCNDKKVDTKTSAQENILVNASPKEIKSQLTDFDKDLNKFESKFYRTEANENNEYLYFSNISNFINQAEKGKDDENKTLAATVKKKLIAIQIKEFPKMRKQYGERKRNELFNKDIDVYVDAKNNTTINFTAALYAANKNMSETNELLSDDFYKFRFKKVTYRWYKDQEDYTMFDFKETQKDGELITP